MLSKSTNETIQLIVGQSGANVKRGSNDPNNGAPEDSERTRTLRRFGSQNMELTARYYQLALKAETRLLINQPWSSLVT